MLGEFPSRSEQTKIHGDKLKKAVRGQLAARSGFTLCDAFSELQDELPIDWNKERGSGEINSIGPSLCNTLRYAYLLTEGFAPKLVTSDECRNAIKNVLEDPDKASIFEDNMWRSPTSYLPLRGVPLQYILRHFYGDAEIRGIELGAGLGNLLSDLNSEKYLVVDFPKKDKLSAFSEHLNINLGLAVDKQERDILWALASDPGFRKSDAEAIREKLNTDEQKFPFLIADLADTDASLDKIHAKINPTGETPHVKFMVSSFLKYQLDDDRGTQQSYNRFATTLIEEGGILIESGEKTVMQQEFKVKVYQKINGEMQLVGIPFIIDIDGKILSTDLDYFRDS